MVLSAFYSGYTAGRMAAFGDAFNKELVPHMLRPQAMQALEEHKAAGHTLALVSASVDFWLQPFAREHGMTLIATKMEVRNNVLTGAFDGPNCWGRVKEERIRATFDLSQFDRIIAYGDSRGDREMLALATERHFKPFR